MKKVVSVDEYMASFPPRVREVLKEMRQAVKEAAPSAEETIGYGMPAYRLNGPLVYFAAQKRHIGFYPTSSGISAFRQELSGYGVSKGTVRFPMGEPLPLGLIKRIVTYRVGENTARAVERTRTDRRA